MRWQGWLRQVGAGVGGMYARNHTHGCSIHVQCRGALHTCQLINMFKQVAASAYKTLRQCNALYRKLCNPVPTS